MGSSKRSRLLSLLQSGCLGAMHFALVTGSAKLWLLQLFKKKQNINPIGPRLQLLVFGVQDYERSFSVFFLYFLHVYLYSAIVDSMFHLMNIFLLSKILFGF